MSFPTKVPGLKWITAVYGLFVFVWISLEGSLPVVILMGVSTTAVLLTYFAQNLLGGRFFSIKQWLSITAVLGFIFGLGSGSLTLLFMVIKTGLHAHGPEFTPLEIGWVMQQILWWAGIGLIAGLGLGLMTGKGRV